jgi:AmmeMemoRadiSam system protein B
LPHAGWYFSGSIACHVIHSLREKNPPDVIVIFGMHLHPGSACYIMTQGAWETPFGELPIEQDIAGELTEKFTFNIETPKHYSQENTIELQLPFIKYFFSNVSIVPIGVPPTKKAIEIGTAVAEISSRKNVNLKLLGSTDLTHYGFNYGFAPKGTGQGAVEWVRNENDARVIDAMLAMNPESVIAEGLERQNACCAGAAAAAIAGAKELGAESAELIAYATSYDKSPGDSLVGYAGIVF